MPMGKGTYGSKVGRPPKTNKNKGYGKSAMPRNKPSKPKKKK